MFIELLLPELKKLCVVLGPAKRFVLLEIGLFPPEFKKLVFVPERKFIPEVGAFILEARLLELNKF